MSLRQQARILEIAPSYLSMMFNGRTPWNSELKERYEELVNTSSKQIAPQLEAEKAITQLWREREGVEPTTPVSGLVPTDLKPN